jgi:hypothetical protein
MGILIKVQRYRGRITYGKSVEALPRRREGNRRQNENRPKQRRTKKAKTTKKVKNRKKHSLVSQSGGLKEAQSRTPERRTEGSTE